MAPNYLYRNFSKRNATLIYSSIFTALSYVAVIAVLYTECLPFSKNFAWKLDDRTSVFAYYPWNNFLTIDFRGMLDVAALLYCPDLT
jgi:hypothetical protein